MTKGEEHLASRDVLEDFKNLKWRLAELFMHFDRVCFTVDGENRILPILVASFGPRGLMHLLEQGAIQFRLNTAVIMHFTGQEDHTPRPKGVHPLAPGRMNTPAHSDPLASVQMGFQWVRGAGKLESKFRKRLEHALASAYVSEDRQAATYSVEFASQAHKSGRLGFLGMPRELSTDDMTLAQVEKLAEVAEQMHDLCIVSSLGLSVINDRLISRLLHDSIDSFGAATRCHDAASRVFEIEGVPALAELFEANPQQVANVPRLRGRSEVADFRRWLHSVSADRFGPEAGEEYLRSVSGNYGFLRTPGARLLKSIVVAGTTTAIGTAMGAWAEGLATGTAVAFAESCRKLDCGQDVEGMAA